MHLEFINECSNIILCGYNGVEKTAIAQNIAHRITSRQIVDLYTPSS